VAALQKVYRSKCRICVNVATAYMLHVLVALDLQYKEASSYSN